MKQDASKKMGLPPVLDETTEILILGSLPSDISLSRQEYYANPVNDFWKIVGAILDLPVATLGYKQKINILRSHRIGLWDAFHHCVRPGSLDARITDEELNDFSILKTLVPKLKLVCFNGLTAAQAEDSLKQLGYATIILPSSSGANRRRQKERLNSWSKALTKAPGGA